MNAVYVYNDKVNSCFNSRYNFWFTKFKISIIRLYIWKYYLSKKIQINHLFKGHRNTRLTLFKDIILATEHGPEGDEINKIFIKVTTASISSYGTPYDQKVENKFKYDHEKFNFIEPIRFYSTIGISEISSWGFIKQEDISNLFVTSLNGKSIFLINLIIPWKVALAEKILIGERIRDIKYLNQKIASSYLETSERLEF